MLTRERLTEIAEYNSADGTFVRRASGMGVKAGARMGSLRKDGYVYVRVDGGRYMAHHLVWLMEAGELPSGLDIDHINRNRADNRFSNLRLATRSENKVNTTSTSRNTSGLRGVHFVKKTGRWKATIGHGGKQTHLGYYSTADEAHAAYVKAATAAFGDYFPSSD